MIVWIALGLLAVLSACAGVSDEDVWHSESAIGERWRLPADVRATGAMVRLEYDEAPRWTGTRGCSGRLQNGTRALAEHLRMKFGAVRSVGGYACRRNTANTARMSVHGTGRALDVFIPLRGRQADSLAGDPVANWLVTHAAQMGIQLVIWNRSVWRANGTNESAYGGPHPHHDHLHVELTEETARALSIPEDDTVLDGGIPDDFWPDASGEPEDAGSPEPFDAGEPTDDGGSAPEPFDAGEPLPDDAPEESELPDDDDDVVVDAGTEPLPPPDTGWEVPEGETGEEDSLGDRPRRSTWSDADDETGIDSAGCSAAPGRTPASDGALLVLVLGGVLLAPRRRRRAPR